jgi:hypothetical protein
MDERLSIGFTPTEETDEQPLPVETIIHMWEDLIYVDALTIIHGRAKAIELVRMFRGYDG